MVAEQIELFIHVTLAKPLGSQISF